MEPKRCPACMNRVSGEVCEHCGYDLRTPVPRHHMVPGTVLNNQYYIGRALGQGGFGITYYAWDLNLDTPVAIKEYYPAAYVHRDNLQSQEVVGNPQAEHLFRNGKEYFLREAKSLAKLSAVPEIVHIRTYFQANGTAYIVMEYITGMPLHKYVMNRGYRISVQETLAILQPVMEALARVHDANLIHRDISPDNIMLIPNGKVKLLDFGAARSSENADPTKALPKSTQAVAKHGYTPVEQYQSRGALGPWTDVYALCATVFFCITGSSPTSAMDRMVYQQNFDWAHLAPELNPYQVDTLNRGLALAPKDRIGSVRELYRGLYGREMFSEPGQTPGAPKAAPDSQGGIPPVTPPNSSVYPATTPVAPQNSSVYPATTPMVPTSGNAYPATAPVVSRVEKPIPEKTAAAAPRKPELTQNQPQGPKTQIDSSVKEKSSEPGNGGKKSKMPLIAAAAMVLVVLVVCFFTVHIWKDPTCTQGERCALCGKAGERTALGHAYVDATCVEDAVCSRCGAEGEKALGHDWQEATCESPECCSRCGERIGMAVGHDWQEATYDAPQTCSICQQTNGHVKGWIETPAGEWVPYASTWAWVANEPVSDCLRFTIDLKISDVERGSVEGTWMAYYHDGTNWIQLGTFLLEGDSVSVTYEFEEPAVFGGIAVIPHGNSVSGYSKELTISEIVVCVD